MSINKPITLLQPNSLLVKLCRYAWAVVIENLGIIAGSSFIALIRLVEPIFSACYAEYANWAGFAFRPTPLLGFVGENWPK